VQIVLIVYGLKLAKDMGIKFKRPALFNSIITVVKIIGFVIVAVNGVLETSILEAQETADEEHNLLLAKKFELLTDINLFLGFADLTIGLFFWLI